MAGADWEPFEERSATAAAQFGLLEEPNRVEDRVGSGQVRSGQQKGH